MVTKRPTYYCLRLRNIVVLAERHRVAVRVRDERERGSDVVRLGDAHQVLAPHVDLLPVREVRRRVEQREQAAARRPRELVSERVAGALGRWETATVRMELLDLQDE